MFFQQISGIIFDGNNFFNVAHSTLIQIQIEIVLLKFFCSLLCSIPKIPVSLLQLLILLMAAILGPILGVHQSYEVNSTTQWASWLMLTCYPLYFFCYYCWFVPYVTSMFVRSSHFHHIFTSYFHNHKWHHSLCINIPQA